MKRSKATREDKRPKDDDSKVATPKKKVVDVKSPKEKKQKEETKKKADKKSDKKVKGKGKEVAVESDEDDEELENAYLTGRVAGVPTAAKEGEGVDGSGKEDDDHEDEDDEAPANLVHESLEKKTKKVRAARTKFVPQDETSEQRDLRTIFIGNLPLETASKKVCVMYFKFIYLLLTLSYSLYKSS